MYTPPVVVGSTSSMTTSLGYMSPTATYTAIGPSTAVSSASMASQGALKYAPSGTRMAGLPQHHPSYSLGTHIGGYGYQSIPGAPTASYLSAYRSSAGKGHAPAPVPTPRKAYASLSKPDSTFAGYVKPSVEKGLKPRVMPPPPKAPTPGVGGLDVCFVMDCTGSMGPWMEASKQTIKDMIAALPDSEPHKRIAFVGYKDFGDGPAQVHPFTEDISAVINFIDRQQAGGGDDFPEDVAGGLAAAVGLQWASQARTVVLIADAPCHGQHHHAFGDTDSYPAGDPTGLSMRTLMQAFRGSHIDFTFVQLLSDTDKMQRNLQLAYESAAGPENISKFELRDLRDIIEEAGGYTALGTERAGEVSAMLSAAVTPSIHASYQSYTSGVQTYSAPVRTSYAGYRGSSARKAAGTAMSAAR